MADHRGGLRPRGPGGRNLPGGRRPNGLAPPRRRAPSEGLSACARRPTWTIARWSIGTIAVGPERAFAERLRFLPAIPDGGPPGFCQRSPDGDPPGFCHRSRGGPPGFCHRSRGGPPGFCHRSRGGPPGRARADSSCGRSPAGGPNGLSDAGLDRRAAEALLEPRAFFVARELVPRPGSLCEPPGRQSLLRSGNCGCLASSAARAASGDSHSLPRSNHFSVTSGCLRCSWCSVGNRSSRFGERNAVGTCRPPQSPRRHGIEPWSVPFQSSSASR